MGVWLEATNLYNMNSEDDQHLKEANLDRWFAEKWVDISRKTKDGRHPPCGRSDASKGSYPKCRPSKKVSKDTPSTSRGMSAKTKARAVAQKRKAEQKPRVNKKPHMTSHHKLKKRSIDEEKGMLVIYSQTLNEKNKILDLSDRELENLPEVVRFDYDTRILDREYTPELANRMFRMMVISPAIRRYLSEKGRVYDPRFAPMVAYAARNQQQWIIDKVVEIFAEREEIPRAIIEILMNDPNDDWKLKFAEKIIENAHPSYLGDIWFLRFIKDKMDEALESGSLSTQVYENIKNYIDYYDAVPVWARQWVANRIAYKNGNMPKWLAEQIQNILKKPEIQRRLDPAITDGIFMATNTGAIEQEWLRESIIYRYAVFGDVLPDTENWLKNTLDRMGWTGSKQDMPSELYELLVNRVESDLETFGDAYIANNFAKGLFEKRRATPKMMSILKKFQQQENALVNSGASFDAPAWYPKKFSPFH